MILTVGSVCLNTLKSGVYLNNTQFHEVRSYLQKTHCFFVTKNKRLMLFKEIIAVFESGIREESHGSSVGTVTGLRLEVEGSLFDSRQR